MEREVPVAFLGGAFQNASSFRNEVEWLVPQAPVVLVDLPGQGENPQQAPELNVGDLARLFVRGLERIGIGRIHLVGLSYGAALAHAIAAGYPDVVEKLVLVGVTRRARPALRGILEHGVEMVTLRKLDEFAFASVHHLFNPSNLERNGISKLLVRRLWASLTGLDEFAQARYVHNTQRLLRSELSGAPSCETLVVSARFDNFVMPHEGLEVARDCPRAKFVLFKKGDHLIPLEQPSALAELYSDYLAGKPIEASSRLDMVDPRSGNLERRVAPRRACTPLVATIADGVGSVLRGRIVDISYDGCFVEVGDGVHGRPLSSWWRAILASEAAELRLPVVVEPAAGGGGVRCIFIKTRAESWLAISRLLA